jgi:hypothetical protein
MSADSLAEFQGTVRLEASSRQLLLRGQQRDGRELVVTFGGYDMTAIPTQLNEVRIMVSRAGGWQLQARERSYTVNAKSMHSYRSVAEEFFKAVPPVAAKPAMRLGWALLLNVLRLPGAAWLLTKLRQRK